MIKRKTNSGLKDLKDEIKLMSETEIEIDY